MLAGAACLAPAATATAAPSDAQLAGQRIVYAFAGTTPPPALVGRIRRGEAGAVILFGRNIASTAQAGALTRRLQAIRRPAGLDVPLLVMVDQEGGSVRRLPDGPAIAAAGMRRASPSRIAAVGRATGRVLRSAGVSVDLAPVADVARPGAQIEREGRAFGREPGAVAARAGAFAQGLAQAGIAAVAKHYPGFGAARATTDREPVRLALASGQLSAVDRRPFREMIAAGVPLVMLSTAVYPALDPRPAALSARIASVELRRVDGFAGVSISDALDTPALAGVGPRATTLAAARAGVDLLIYAGTLEAGERAARDLTAALRRGRADRSAALRSFGRVLELRRALAGEDGGLAAYRERIRLSAALRSSGVLTLCRW